MTVADDGGDKARGLIAAAGALLPARIPANFAELLFARTAPEDLLAYSAGRSRQARPGRLGVPRRAPARQPEDAGAVAARRRPARRHLGHRDRQRRQAVPARLHHGRAHRARRRGAPRRPSGAARRARPGRPRSPGLSAEGARESFIHIHVGRIDDEERKSRILGALGDVLTEVQLAVADWRPMLGRVERGHRRPDPPAAAAPGRRDRRSDRVPAVAAAGQLHLPGRARGRLRRPQRRAHAQARQRARHPAPPRRRGDDRGRRAPGAAGRGARHARGAAGAGHQQDQPAVARAPPRRHGPGRRQALRRGRPARRPLPHRRPVHLDRLYALDPRHPVSAPQDRLGDRPRRPRRRQPFRQGARGRARAISARRAVRDRRGDAAALRADDPAPRRAPARARAGAARPVRPLRLGAGLRAARPLRQHHPRGDRRAPGRRLSRQAGVVHAVLSRRPAGARALHHRARRREPLADPKRTELEGGVADVVRTWNDALADAIAEAHAPAQARALLARYQDAFSAGLSRGVLAARRGARHPHHRRARAGPPARGRFLSAPVGRDGSRSASRSGATAGRSRCPSACRCSSTWASG